MDNNSRMVNNSTVTNYTIVNQETTKTTLNIKERDANFTREFLKSRSLIDNLTEAMTNLNTNEEEKKAETISIIEYEDTLAMYTGNKITRDSQTNEPTNTTREATKNKRTNQDNQTNMCYTTWATNSPRHFQNSLARTNMWVQFQKEFEKNLTKSEKKKL